MRPSRLRRQKRPCVEWKELQGRLPTDAELVEWFGPNRTGWFAQHAHRIGMLTGATSGVVVVEWDPQHGAQQSFLDRFTSGRIALSGDHSGVRGQHLHFEHPGKPTKTAANCFPDFPGVDIRGDGGFVMLPPSPHYSGVSYEWLTEGPLAPLPAALFIPRTSDILIEDDLPPLGSRTLTEAQHTRIGEVMADQWGGNKHYIALGLTGAFIKAGLSAEKTLALVTATCGSTSQKVLAEHRTRLATTVKRSEAGESIGGTSLLRQHGVTEAAIAALGSILFPPIEMLEEDALPARTLPPFPATAWRGLFDDYRAAVAPASECPEPFHFANLLVFLAAEMGRLFTTDEALPTTANCYVINIGITGTKKSTATDFLVEYLARTGVDPYILASVSSGEAFIRVLKEHDSTLLRIDELADILQITARGGTRIEPLLNTAFNLGPLATHCKNINDSMELAAHTYSINLIANGTPDHVEAHINTSTMFGGLINRALVFAAEPSGVKMPFMCKPDPRAITALTSVLAQRRTAWEAVPPAPGYGAITIGYTAAAMARYEAWYHAQPALDEQHAKLLTRIPLYVKKVAMVYCYAEATPALSVYITDEQMAAAIAVVEYCAASMRWATENWSGPKTILQQSQNLIERKLLIHFDKVGCTSQRAIARALHLSAQDIVPVLAKMNGTHVRLHALPKHAVGVHSLTCQCPEWR